MSHEAGYSTNATMLAAKFAGKLKGHIVKVSTQKADTLKSARCETTIVPADVYRNTNFEKVYHGDGMVHTIRAGQVTQGVSEMFDFLLLGERPLQPGEELPTYNDEEVSLIEKSFHISPDAPLEECYGGCVRLYTSETALPINIDPHPAFGKDPVLEVYSFYKAINHALNNDLYHPLRAAAPFIRGFNNFLNNEEKLHAGGKLHSGVSVKPDLLDLSTTILKEGALVRIPRFLSTSAQLNVAYEHAPNYPEQNLKGLVITINVEKDFWGCRDIAEISDFEWEAETIFPPYSQYVVESFDNTGEVLRKIVAEEFGVELPDEDIRPLLVLKAVDKYFETPMPQVPEEFKEGDKLEVWREKKCCFSEGEVLQVHDDGSVEIKIPKKMSIAPEDVGSSIRPPDAEEGSNCEIWDPTWGEWVEAKVEKVHDDGRIDAISGLKKKRIAKDQLHVVLRSV